MSEITRSEAIDLLDNLIGMIEDNHESKYDDALKFAITSLKTDEAYNLMYEQPEFCEDCISRFEVTEILNSEYNIDKMLDRVADLPSVLPDVTDNNVGELTIHCKDCKFFEYDHFEDVFGVPLIVAHEVCTKWGDACKTNENGACFLAERKTAAAEEED